MVVRSGNNATAEGIKELEQRRIQSERLARTKPATPFSDVLAKKQEEQEEEPEPSEKEKRFAALPKKGPAPGLVHPAQRDAYGRDGDENEETVVLKG
jgi:hypothetical protein